MFKKDFPIFNHIPRLIYLDSAATTQKPQCVLDAVNAYYEEYNANIHRGLYPIAEKASAAVEKTRAKVAQFINASPDEIIFTKSATEAVNLIAYAWGNHTVTNTDVICTSIFEHHANFVPWQQLALRKHAQFTVVKNFKLPLPQAILYAFSLISNVTGEMHPIENLITATRQEQREAYFMIDASQAMLHTPIDVKKMDCDFLTFTGHKMFAETGIGVLFVKKKILATMPPFLFGGDMITQVSETQTTFVNGPQRFEAGTQHISGIISLGAAIAYIEEIGWKRIQAYEQSLSTYTREQLLSVPGINLLSEKFSQVTKSIFSFLVPPTHPHDIAQMLAEANICIRSGHHCAMPLHTFYKIPASCRLSLSIYNDEHDITRCVAAIKSANHRLTTL